MVLLSVFLHFCVSARQSYAKIQIPPSTAQKTFRYLTFLHVRHAVSWGLFGSIFIYNVEQLHNSNDSILKPFRKHDILFSYDRLLIKNMDFFVA